MINKIQKVEKRDGRIVDFDRSRIETVIHKALTATVKGNGARSKKLTDRVLQILNRRFKPNEVPHVEQIQNIVEEVLILEGLVETAKAYILYREQRRRMRDAATTMDEAGEAIDKYIQEVDWQVKENANMTYSLQGLNQYTVAFVSKKYWLNKIYPKEVREAAVREDFHIHNLETLACYCMGWDLYDLLLRGFGGAPGKIESRPAKHFRTALGQLVNFFFTLQGETAGANAVSNFDTLLAPFIRYDNLDYLQVKQVLQEFLYNCMVPTRVGFQTPFLNVSLDIKIPDFLKNQPVIIGGKPQNETYGEFQEEVSLFVKAFYETLMEGDARGRVFTFPIPTVSITKDFDWENPVLDPLWEATAKYGVNYFCLTEDTLVYESDKGRLPIKELREGNSILTESGFKKVKKIFKLKADKIAEITLKSGGTIRATLNHRFPLADGELKQVSAISLGDRLLSFLSKEITLSSGIELSPLDQNVLDVFTLENGKLSAKTIEEIRVGETIFLKNKSIFGRNTSLPGFEFSPSPFTSNTNNIKIPATFSPDLARFIGYMIGDGSYYGNGKKLHLMTFVNADKEVLIDFQNLIRKLFGDSFAVNERMVGKNKKTLMFSWSSVMLRKFLLSLGLDYVKRKDKKIPAIIFETTEENVKHFLRGLFETDGSIDKKGNVVLTQVSRETIYGTQQLLFRLGIFSKVTSKQGYFKIQILGKQAVKFGECVGFVSARKQERFKAVGSNRPCLGDYAGISQNVLALFEGVKKAGQRLEPDLQFVYDKVKYRHRGRVTPDDLGVIIQELRKGNCVSSDYESMKFIWENELFCDTVVSNHPVQVSSQEISAIKIAEGNFNVVDLSVDSPTHLFVVGAGILTHNSNYVNSDMKPEDVRSMCCHLRLDKRELYKRGGGLFGANPLTGSIGVCTINMPRIGYLSKTKKEFFEKLTRLMDLAKESLEIKRKALEGFMEKGLYPYSRHYLEAVKKMRGCYYGNHFSTIGLLGMNEALLNFLGENIGSKRGRKFALEVLNFMREKIVKYQEETGNLYNLEATPAEGTSFRQAKADKDLYPEIITAGTKEVPYYTNSTMLPVNFTDDIFEALKLQDDLQCRYSGGTVLHLFLGEQVSDINSAKALVRKVFEKYHLPYITLTPTFSVCPSHGYLSGEHFFCPQCTIKQPCEVYSRVVGYYRPVQQFHIGKIREYHDRKEFKLKANQVVA
jgi:ribonucleoside-triphosphate reductase